VEFTHASRRVAVSACRALRSQSSLTGPGGSWSARFLASFANEARRSFRDCDCLKRRRRLIMTDLRIAGPNPQGSTVSSSLIWGRTAVCREPDNSGRSHRDGAYWGPSFFVFKAKNRTTSKKALFQGVSVIEPENPGLDAVVVRNRTRSATRLHVTHHRPTGEGLSHEARTPRHSGPRALSLSSHRNPRSPARILRPAFLRVVTDQNSSSVR
jgi:hypothetical protein